MFVETGRVAAHDWIARFEGEWRGSVDAGLCGSLLLTVDDPTRICVFSDADINARGASRRIESQIA